MTSAPHLPPPSRSSPREVTLSVVMAAHNEARTIEAAVGQVLAVTGPFDLELIVVDDGSTDDTLRLLRAIDDPRLTVLSHPRSRGKGAAVLSGASVATGTHLLVFDADLEYSASDIPSLLEPIIDGSAEVVYGARVAGFHTAYQTYRFRLGAELTTRFANLVFDAGITDMHTCLKLVPMDLFRQLVLTEEGFGLDTELTGELLRRGLRPFEIPCTYHGRSRAAGKAISLHDGWECLKVIVRVRFRGVEPWTPGSTGEAQERPSPSTRDDRSRAMPVPAPGVAGDAGDAGVGAVVFGGGAGAGDHAA